MCRVNVCTHLKKLDDQIIKNKKYIVNFDIKIK